MIIKEGNEISIRIQILSGPIHFISWWGEWDDKLVGGGDLTGSVSFGGLDKQNSIKNSLSREEI